MSLQRSAINLLEQLEAVIEQLSDEKYQQSLSILSNASIGQHVRHTLEFFLCLIDAQNEHQLNYDLREHDRYIEQETNLAKSVVNSIKDILHQSSSDFPLTLEANYEVDRKELVRIPSNFYRELAYNIEHTIHHMALIKIGIKDSFSEVKLPDNFGVASSTIRYQKDRHS